MEIGEKAEAYDQDIKQQVVDRDKDAEFIQLSPEERARWAKVAQPIWDEYVAGLEAKGLPGQEMLDDIQQWVAAYKK
jgi:hypothetical protein